MQFQTGVGEGELMTERVPLLEIGKLLASVHDLEAKYGEPPW